VLPLLPIPIVPEHVWKNVSEKEMKSYGQRADGGKPVVGSGPFRLVRAPRAARRSSSRPTRTTGAARRTSTRSTSGLQEHDPAVQALIKGEVDFVETSPRCR
jgi:peptide/nickel transport system substrate-binding protein